MSTNQESRYKSWPQVCLGRNLGWILMGKRKGKWSSCLSLGAESTAASSALLPTCWWFQGMLEVVWSGFVAMGKVLEKAWISCRTPILWVFHVQFLLRTLRIIPLIRNCLNVETYGLVCCSLGNNWLFPSCQIQINSGCRKGESAAAQRNFKGEGFLVRSQPDV